VLLFAILNLAVFLINVISVWHYGALFSSGGNSGVTLYPIWKEIHHLQIYEWPLTYPFSLSLFNYLYYFTYAFFLKVVGASDPSLMKWGSLFTPVFAIVGAIAQWKLVGDYLSLRGARSVLSLFFALGLWFCTSLVRGWALTIRPDIPSIALVMIALWIVVRQPRFGFAYAGVVFYLAWSYKQSAVLSFVGVCLFLAFHRRWRDLSLLVAFFAVLTTATLLLGTPEYRYSILVAPRLVTEFSLMHAIPIALKFIVGNAYWVLAPVALILAADGRRIDSAIRVLVIVFAVALAGGLAGLTKAGAYSEYLLEAFVAGSTLLQMAVFMAPGRFVNTLLLFGCVQPSIQLATMPSGANNPHTFGTVGIATEAQYQEAVALRERLASMKKPIFTPDGVFSLPWFSTDDRAPALVIEQYFHDATRDSCSNGCVEGMLQRGEIPTVMLPISDFIYQKSLSPSYEKVAEVPYSEKLWDIYVLKPLPSNSSPSISH
jgi:hypothetical protein